MFEAEFGSATKGHIAIDDIDIKLVDTKCSIFPETADPTGNCSFFLVKVS